MLGLLHRKCKGCWNYNPVLDCVDCAGIHVASLLLLLLMAAANGCYFLHDQQKAPITGTPMADPTERYVAWRSFLCVGSLVQHLTSQSA